MHNRRAENRFRSRGTFRILVDDHEIDAKIFDASPSGMSLLSNLEFAPGLEVRLELCGLEFARGVVRNCRAHGGGFVIGVSVPENEFQDQARESTVCATPSSHSR
jgi:PilZ domain